MGRRDEIGTRGEALFTAAIMNFCGRERPYFVSHFLGDKFQTLDFIVELVGVEEAALYFFVQVRTTRRGYSKGGARLKVSLRKEAILRMRMYPAPTYLVGIDEVGKKAYILSIDEGSQASISGMPTKYELDCANLKKLWDEVNAYWESRDMRVRESVFSA